MLKKTFSFHYLRLKHPRAFLSVGVVVLSVLVCIVVFLWNTERQKLFQKQLEMEQARKIVVAQLEDTQQQLTAISKEDQVAKNRELQIEIRNIQTTYKSTVDRYGDLLDLRGNEAKTQDIEKQFSLILSYLSKLNYASASATLAQLQKSIATLQAQSTVAVTTVPANMTTSNTPPGSGYSKQVVTIDAGTFVVDILATDLNSTRVQLETASSGDCKDNCPVDTLASFVAKSGGFAGINGPYFCPAEYPSCVGKTNSFDTLQMNKNKVYFNSDNNVYSTVPAIIFSGTSVRVVGQSLEWGRDTSVDAEIANIPLLVSSGEVRFGGDGDPKKAGRGNRSFIGNKGATVYIGVVHGVSVAEQAQVLKAMGLDNALHLDDGGSTAFYVNGKYVDGPGRNTPFGIVLVRR